MMPRRSNSIAATALTVHLLERRSSQKDYVAATQHPFLRDAGSRALPGDLLALWLSQDRIYAQAYPRFIGNLLTKLTSTHANVTNYYEAILSERILKTLAICLQNIVKEIDFFKDVSTRYGLHMDCWLERPGTRNYTAEMGNIGSFGSIHEGMVFLWAMEKVYLDSWRYAKSQSLNAKLENGDTKAVNGQHRVHSALDEFMGNWTSDEFAKFVDDLGKIVNDLFRGIEGTDEWRKAEAVFDRVLELEKAFWPLEGEDKEMKTFETGDD